MPMNPSPLHDVVESVLATGAGIVIRPIRPDDEGMMVHFHEGLSDRSVYQRYFHMLTLARRTAHDRLTRVCHPDFHREFVLVAEGRDDESGAPAILGVARLQRIGDGAVAEFAVVVADHHQGIGVGGALMRQVVAIARRESVPRLRADILAENGPMRRLCGRAGIPVRPTADPLVVEADLAL
jgi:acetyltransferase